MVDLNDKKFVLVCWSVAGLGLIEV